MSGGLPSPIDQCGQGPGIHPPHSYERADKTWWCPGYHQDGRFEGAQQMQRLEVARPQTAADELTAADDVAKAMEGIKALLRLVGENPTRTGLRDTPARVVRAFQEMTDRPGDPASLLAKTFDDADYPSDEMVAVGPVEFTSLCEHHLLPFTGHAWVAYLPTPGKVVGLSKLARLVDHYARRPQVQERMTTQIADAIDKHLVPLGSAVKIVATHSCMSLRGVVKSDARMTTSVLRGRFQERPATRAEFLALTNGKATP